MNNSLDETIRLILVNLKPAANMLISLGKEASLYERLSIALIANSIAMVYDVDFIDVETALLEGITA